MTEYIFEMGDALYNEETGEAIFQPKVVGELVRCRDCIHSSVLLDEYDNECGYACNITYDAGGFWLEVEKDHFCRYGERGDSE